MAFVLILEAFTPKPLNNLYIFLVPLVFFVISSMFGHKRLSLELTVPLFVVSLGFYAFGGHVFDNPQVEIKKVSQVKNINQLSALVAKNSYNLPSKIDELTTLTNISVNTQDNEYELTLMLSDIYIEHTDRRALNNTLSLGLSQQCHNESFRHLNHLGIKITYHYIDANRQKIGKHQVNLKDCQKKQRPLESTAI